MILNDFKQMLGINGEEIKEEHCCCIKSATHVMSAQRAVNELKYGGAHGEELFDCFNSVQGGHFAKRMISYPFVYMFMGEGDSARFYALYEVLESITRKDANQRGLIPSDYRTKIEGEGWQSLDHEPFFVLRKHLTPGGLEGRLLVNFYSGQQNAPTFIAAGKYTVTQIDPLRVATEFIDYKSVRLTYNELKLVVKDEKWKDMLSRFGGVYLIHDDKSGKNYVGSAYSKFGFWGRGNHYAEFPTGGSSETGNTELVKLLSQDPEYADKHFHYSILEVLPLVKEGINQAILDAEVRWKIHLGTRTWGLNSN